MSKDKAHDIYVTLGASNHTQEDRENNDYYATEPKATNLLLQEETFTNVILEPCCGEGHISEQLIKNGYQVISSDLVNRGYGEVKDFYDIKECDYDIITNPPYKVALPLLKHAIEIVPEGRKVAMFLRLLFLEGKERKKFFNEHPPKTIYVASGRLTCAKNGDFDRYPSGAVAYAWFVWEKGYKGKPVIKWIN